MRTLKFIVAFALFCSSWGSALAHLPGWPNVKRTVKKTVEYREVCANSLAQVDQEINNVRARLLAGGDVWWDLTDGKYVVPKVDPASGQPEVSSIFAGAVWLGGRDPGGSLKLACQNYRSDGLNDFWTGPLDTAGKTERAICANWDRHFRVTGAEIREHIKNIRAGNLSEDAIPRGVKGWPAQNNVLFDEVWGFDLPNTPQGLAGFYDVDGDGNYEPKEGDYPSIEIRGCALDRYPDEMLFWIYNDQGGGASHANTKGNAIQMEVQVQAFGYVTNDELNDMTFQRYKLINRATEYIDSMYFAMWADPDLGCSADDYIGCDTTLDLMYVYNQDGIDGQPLTSCDGVPTYGAEIPLLGIDYFRGPLRQILDDDGAVIEEIEIGMSSFTYHNGNNAPPGTEDPNGAGEHYNLLKGLWRDAQPVTVGGNGRGGDTQTKFVFPDRPDDQTGWNMVNANLPVADRRTLQTSGPFRLNPGAVNELIIGVPWVPNIPHPAPDIEPLIRADKLAQGLFNNCFELQNGPDAPFVDWVELDKQLIAVLNYQDSATTNNYNQTFFEKDIFAPENITDVQASYKFEGYKVYQLRSPNVSTKEYETNADVSRLVANVDVKNGITKIFNWTETINPVNGEKYYIPTQRASGEDKGIRNTFNITEDRFAQGNDKRLINHKKYYFVAIAYAYNNFEDFDAYAIPVTGQQRPYLVGRRASYGDGQITPFTVTPRPIVDQVLNSAYGQGVEITRLQGAGVKDNFLDLKKESRDALFTGISGDTTLTYKEGRGPIEVIVFNPFEVKDGDYEIEFVDGDNADNKLADTAHWVLRRAGDAKAIRSAVTIDAINEQIVKEYGFSVSIAQTAEPGDKEVGNGAIGAQVEYTNPDVTWLNGTPVGTVLGFGIAPFNFFNRARDAFLDPKEDLVKMGNGWFVPYALADWALQDGADDVGDPRTRMITPAWTESLNATGLGNDNARLDNLRRLPNVDIVMTTDRSKWSRCMVVETASRYWTNPAFPKAPGYATQSSPTRVRSMFDVRYSPSVSKDDNDGDGLPDPDNALNPTGISASEIPLVEQGKPVYGMGWFPGYAIDVETGRRLNIFFGENSVYKSGLDSFGLYTGRDMLFNPTGQMLNSFPQDYYNLVMGGHHYVYVMSTPYDECEAIRRRFTPEFAPTVSAANPRKVSQIKNIAWAGMLTTDPGFQMKSLKDGLVPTETVVKLRVNNKYQTWWDEKGGSLTSKANPKYSFKIKGMQVETRTLATDLLRANALDSIKVVPNPYYGYSQYEITNFSNIVKITNLPAKCNITIYSLDGKFIRQYKRDEQYEAYKQISPELVWDLKNSKGIPVASGVYLIQVQAPGFGERTVKWFGIARQFDPTGL